MTDERLRRETLTLFGDVTVAGAERHRDALAQMDAAAWARLVAARDAMAEAPPEEKRAICQGLDEPTRRRLALCLLDRGFLETVAQFLAGDAGGT